MEEYMEREKFWCMMKMIAVGSTVRITTTAQSYEDNWNNTWPETMDSFVGKTGVVYSFESNAEGIAVRIAGAVRWYPYWVVEPVREVAV